MAGLKKLKLLVLILLSSCFVSGQYSTEYLSAPRSRIATAQFDDEIFFIAGSIDNNTGFDIVDKLNTSTGLWSTQTFISDGASSVNVDQNEDYLMLSKLTDVNLNLGDLVRYVRASNTWTRFDYSGFINGGDDTVLFDHYFWITDGDDSYDLAIYDFVTNLWSSETLPFSIEHRMVSQHNNQIFFAGGGIGTTPQEAVDVYDIASDSWSSFNLTVPRRRSFLLPTYFQYEDKYIIAGGATGGSSGSVVDLVEVIDLNTYNIDTYHLNEKKYDLCGCGTNDVLVFAGGTSTELDVLDLKTGGQLLFELGAENDLDELQCGVVGNTVIMAGGNSTEGDTVYVYNTNFHTLNKVALDFSRNEVAITSLNGKLYIAGGEDPNNITTDEVLIFEEIDGCTISITHGSTDNISGSYKASGEINSTTSNISGDVDYTSKTLVTLDSGFETNGIYHFCSEIGDCGDVCSIDLGYTETPCDVGVNCSNFDDSFTFSITPTVVDGGTHYDVTGDISQTNIAFGTTLDFTNNIVDGPIAFIITDLTTGCIFPFNINPPEFCSMSGDVFTCATAYEMTETCIYSAPGPTIGDGCYDCSGNTNHANWFTYTATSNATVSIESCGSGQNTNLYVYEGDCSALVQIASDANDCFPDAQILDIPVVTGIQYYFEWDDRYDDDPFEFTFTIN